MKLNFPVPANTQKMFKVVKKHKLRQQLDFVFACQVDKEKNPIKYNTGDSNDAGGRDIKFIIFHVEK